MTPEVAKLLHMSRVRYWTPRPTSAYILESKNKEAQYNMYYILRGRPATQAAGEMKKYVDVWNLAYRIVNRRIQDIPVKEFVTLMSSSEFYTKIVLPNPRVFEQFYPTGVWMTMLYEKTHKTQALE